MHELSQTNETLSVAWGPRGAVGASFAGEVTLADVTFRIGDKAILDNVSLKVPAGTVTSLLGPSGCGKTTLLRLIAGVSRPTSGQIKLDQIEVAGGTKFVPPEKRNVGLVFQDYALFPHLTVLQNVTYGLYALSRTEAERAALRVLERVGLAAHGQRFPHQLSGGEQQRVALARAIAPRPQVILLDEPFSGLDQRLREHVRAETLAVIRETRATAILVTHDPSEAVEVADQIHVLRHGRIIQGGSPRELLHNPLDVGIAQFFGPGTLLQGRARNGRVETVLGTFASPGFVDETHLDILIRPKAIKVTDKSVVRAYVSNARFVGETQKLTLRLEQLESAVEAEVDAREVIEIGQELPFAVDPTGVFVFKSQV